MAAKNLSEMTDKELADYFNNTGKADYFNSLMKRYLPLLYGYFLKYLKNPEDAEETTVELIDQLKSDLIKSNLSDFRSWLYGYLQVFCKTKLPEGKKNAIAAFSENFKQNEKVISVLTDKENTENRALVADCINRLPESQRVCLTMFFYEGWSYAEISRKTGFRPGSVIAYIEGGKTALKEYLDKKGIK